MRTFLKLIFCNFIFIINSYNSNGQYKPFPKLETLYNNQDFEKCISKAETILEEESKEIYPSFWQMKSYMRLHEMPNSAQQKIALNKALNIAIRIKRKDKLQTLLTKNKTDFDYLIENVLKQASLECQKQKDRAILRFSKLLEWDTNANFLIAKINCTGNNNLQTNDLAMAENIMVKNYRQFHNKDLAFINQENIFALYLNAMLQQNQTEAALDVFEKATEIYKTIAECNLVLEKYITERLNKYNYISGTENEEILKLLNLFNTKQQLPFYATSENKINFNFIEQDIIEAKEVAKPEITTNMTNYFNYFADKKIDTSNKYMYNKILLAKNTTQKNALFYLWTGLNKSLSNKNTNASITTLQSFINTHSNYSLAYEYLEFASKNYSDQKALVLQLKNKLDAMVIEKINNKEIADSLELLNKIAANSGNKYIKDKHLLNTYNKLKQFLNTNDYESFVYHMQNAQQLYVNNPQLLALKKDFIVQDYLQNFTTLQASPENKFEKLPDVNSCYEGIVNEAGHEVTLRAINYARRLVGIASPCRLDPNLNKTCQKAALLMYANGQLDHHPPKEWKCFTTEGSAAAGYSNLSYGHNFYDAVFGQLEDYGGNNFAVGHRRWILNPNNYIFGHGSSQATMVLSTFGFSPIKYSPKYTHNENLPICWPAADYFPSDLVPARWSFGMLGAQFENAKVTITQNGKPIAVKLEPIDNGYGMNTLVFVPETQGGINNKFIVTISNFELYNYETSTSKKMNYSYSFTIINPSP